MADNIIEEISNSPSLSNVDDQLVDFLRSLANSIERRQLKPEQMGRIGEFFMSYCFSERLDEGNREEDNEEITQDDFMKFLVMGWYVYRMILRGENLESNNTDQDQDPDQAFEPSL